MDNRVKYVRDIQVLMDKEHSNFLPTEEKRNLTSCQMAVRKKAALY